LIDQKVQPIQMIGLGELLWDCFPDRRLPGGAPANVAFHAQQLGLSAAVATRVGDDDLGHEIHDFLESKGLNVSLVQFDAERPTGTVTISPLREGNASYQFRDNSAWDFLLLERELIDALTTLRAICFGTLAQRKPTTCKTIYQCLERVPKDCVIVYDVNLRSPFFDRGWISNSLQRSTIVKLNSDEVLALAQLFDLPSITEINFARTLLYRYPRLQLVCVTRGEAGCMAVTRDEAIEMPGIRVDVVDTVGAGDAFTAAIVYGELEGWRLEKTVDLANHFGSTVAARQGAMPSIQDELSELKLALEWRHRDTPLC
jgi:fructokinase